MDAPSMQNEGRVYGIYSMIAVILKHGKNIMDAQVQMKISLKADEVYRFQDAHDVAKFHDDMQVKYECVLLHNPFLLF